jgi:transposase
VVLEARRMLAGKLLSEGVRPLEVARLVGAGPSSVRKWKCVLDKQGLPGLAAKPQPPPPSKLGEAQRAQLVQILIAGPLASGYATHLWTCRRVNGNA